MPVYFGLLNPITYFISNRKELISWHNLTVSQVVSVPTYIAQLLYFVDIDFTFVLEASQDT